MASIRGLWVLREDEVLLSRRFPTVENRVRLFDPSTFGIPSDQEFFRLFKQRVLDADSTNRLHNVAKLGENIWPVVYMKRSLVSCNLAEMTDPDVLDRIRGTKRQHKMLLHCILLLYPRSAKNLKK